MCLRSTGSGLVSFCIIFHNMYIMHYFVYLYIIRQFFEFSVIHLYEIFTRESR
nr:MAG TPA: hypothetical protein [Caudoviricetes sp.]